MKLSLYLFLFVPFVSLSQANIDMAKWKRAIINLEVRTRDTTGYAEMRSNEIGYKEKLLAKVKDKIISADEYLDSAMAYNLRNPTLSKKIIFTGTCIFYKAGGKRYLITARHVVFDTIGVAFQKKYHNDTFDRSLQLFEDIFIIPNYSYELNDTSRNHIKITQTTINIKGISEGDKFTKSDSASSEATLISNHRLFGFTAFEVVDKTPRECYPVTFSNAGLDLAILSLDNKYAMYLGDLKYKNLGDYLESKGYLPITIDDLADEPSSEGSNIFTVGFPGATSKVAFPNLSPVEKQFSALEQSLPVFAFGKVAMLAKELAYFWSDMSIYPGNSGGPVIENGKLVGIVSRQATNDGVRIPFGLIIKAKYVKELLKIQQQKDTCGQFRKQ